jgi:inorganic pyrophosphatase
MINVTIEIPTDSDPVKYEVDDMTGEIYLDRFLNVAMRYPCNYGYIPSTLAEDGDPIDVLVLSPYPLLSQCIAKCRPVGMLEMSDEDGRDFKILAVPDDEMYENIQCIDDVDKSLLRKIEHFFTHYKDLEDGKWTVVKGWKKSTAAISVIKQYTL